jgi:hypothetical protein
MLNETKEMTRKRTRAGIQTTVGAVSLLSELVSKPKLAKDLLAKAQARGREIVPEPKLRPWFDKAEKIIAEIRHEAKSVAKQVHSVHGSKTQTKVQLNSVSKAVDKSVSVNHPVELDGQNGKVTPKSKTTKPTKKRTAK